MTIDVDPITVSVMQHRLTAIVEEMGEAMLRTSYSQILNSSRDFSAALCTAEGDLVAQAEHIPVHVGAMPWAARSVAEVFAAQARPGDVYLLNDPCYGGSHLPDITAVVPVFADGQLAFWSLNRAHQSDIGGATHGAYNANATEIWHEGLRIPPLKLHDQGVLREDVLEMLSANVRHPSDFKGDLFAMIGSVHIGERRVRALMAEYGPEVVLAAGERIMDAAERQARAIFATWADGTYHGSAMLDDDGRGNEDITVRAEVTVRGSELVIDLEGSDPQTTSFINSSYANMRSAVAMAIAYMVDPEVAKNDGMLRAVTVKAREGTVVWAAPGAPVTLCTSHCAQEIIEAIVKALAQACPERAMAGWGRRFRIAISGEDPRTGKQFIWHLFHARPGGGASAGGDGWHAVGEWHSAGGLKFGSIEVAEARYPLYFGRHEFRPDSGGAGKYRGGAGVDLELRLETAKPAVVNTAGDGARHGACGMNGGEDGRPHDYAIRSPGKRRRRLLTKEEGVVVEPGVVFEIHSGGGGGWGPAPQRDAGLDARDRREGLIRARAAKTR